MQDKLITIAYFASILVAIFFFLKCILLIIGWTQSSKIPVYNIARNMGKDPDIMILKSIIINLIYMFVAIAVAYILF